MPAATFTTTFPDQGSPIADEALTEDLLEAEYENGMLPETTLVEIASNPGCFIEKEAAEAWMRLERHALHDGVEFTAAWCYRNIKTQRRTYRRNCPLVVTSPVEDPAVPESGDPPPTDEVEEADEVSHTRVCRVPTATPGNSNHGWGRAVDITADEALLTCESDAFLWLVANASRYGWVHPRWAACEADKEEAWHWEWGGTKNAGPNLSRRNHYMV